MYNVFIQTETSQENLRSFVSPFLAEEYFFGLCKKRTDGPAAVVLTNNRRLKKKYHLDREWSGERLTWNEETVC